MLSNYELQNRICTHVSVTSVTWQNLSDEWNERTHLGNYLGNKNIYGPLARQLLGR